MPTQTVHDGDQHHEMIALRHCDDALRGFGKLSRGPKDVIPDAPGRNAS